MKKELSLSIIFCLFLTLVSCSVKPVTEDDESFTDFNEATFTVLSDGTWLTSYLPLSLSDRKRGDSASTDRFLDRIEEIEQKYNVVFTNEHGNLQSKILSMSVSGGSGADMLYCGNDILFSLYKLGILVPFGEIGVKDNDNIKFGIPSLLVEGTFDGIRFGIINYLGDTVPYLQGIISINPELLNSLSMTDPHEYAEKGEWNWENLRIVLAQGTFTEGNIRHVGMASDYPIPGSQAFFPAIISNGGYLIKEIDGVYKSGICEPNAIEAMEFVTNLLNDGIMEVAASGMGNDFWEDGTHWPLFYNNTETDLDYPLVTFPYGPSGNKDIVAAYSTNREYYAFTLLSSFGNDEIGLLVDEIFEPLDSSLYPEGWKDYAIDNIFQSDTDYETYMTGLETLQYYPLGLIYGTNPWTVTDEIMPALDNILFGRGTAQAELDAVKDLLHEDINEKLNSVK